MTIKFSIFTHFFLQDLTHFYLSLHPLSKLQIWSHFFLCYVVYFLLQCHLSRSVETITDFIYLFKGPSSQSYGFFSSPVWMWELDYKESWLLKNWCFWTMVLEKTLESPLSARRSNQSILKEISPEYSLEGLLLKLKLQYFGYLTHWRRPWCWERLKEGGEGDNRRWDGWMASLTWWTWVCASLGSWW